MSVGWKVSAKRSEVGDVRLVDIMSEQVVQDILHEDHQHGASQSPLSDYEMALQLQEQFLSEVEENETSDDAAILEFLQMQEDEEIGDIDMQSTTGQGAVSSNSGNVFVVKRSELSTATSKASRPVVASQAWDEAVALERRLGQYDSETQAALLLHDPLLRKLSSTDALTEVEGAGDVSGEGFLVSKAACADVHAFARQRAKLQYRKSKGKKASGGPTPAASITSGEISRQDLQG